MYNRIKYKYIASIKTMLLYNPLTCFLFSKEAHVREDIYFTYQPRVVLYIIIYVIRN